MMANITRVGWKNSRSFLLLMVFGAMMSLSAKSLIDSIRGESYSLGAIVKECSQSKSMAEARICTQKFLKQELANRLEKTEGWTNEGEYFIQFSVYSRGEPEVDKVIRLPRSVNKGDEELLKTLFDEIVQQQDWIPLIGLSNGMGVGIAENLKINLAEL